MGLLFSACDAHRFNALWSLSGDRHTDEGQELGCGDYYKEIYTDPVLSHKRRVR